MAMASPELERFHEARRLWELQGPLGVLRGRHFVQAASVAITGSSKSGLPRLDQAHREVQLLQGLLLPRPLVVWRKHCMEAASVALDALSVLDERSLERPALPQSLNAAWDAYEEGLLSAEGSSVVLAARLQACAALHDTADDARERRQHEEKRRAAVQDVVAVLVEASLAEVALLQALLGWIARLQELAGTDLSRQLRLDVAVVPSLLALHWLRALDGLDASRQAVRDDIRSDLPSWARRLDDGEKRTVEMQTLDFDATIPALRLDKTLRRLPALQREDD